MDPDKDIIKKFDRFSVIVNGLKGFDKIISKEKLIESSSTLFSNLGIQENDYH